MVQLEKMLEENLFYQYEDDSLAKRKRGRPSKNRLEEKKLVEWIKSTGRTIFTKKEINRMYFRFTKKQYRSIST